MLQMLNSWYLMVMLIKIADSSWLLLYRIEPDFCDKILSLFLCSQPQASDMWTLKASNVKPSPPADHKKRKAESGSVDLDSFEPEYGGSQHMVYMNQT